MIPGLPDRLDARTIFVVGKGGVGKTTTAGALALAFADAGADVHLLSADPAHSLGDLFSQDVADGVPAPSTCSPRLVLEELDAVAYARDWAERAGEPIAELVERGTYLDAEDVEGFLDLSLPGVDEVSAALRLAELAGGEADRIVVDTAPTGHTLRLLDAGGLIEGWTGALRAMEEKASVVASRLVRRPVRLAAAELLDELDARVGRFQAEVLSRALFVVVTAAGRVIGAETDRLRRELRRRGLEMAAEVRTGGDGDEGVFVAPWRSDARGCEGVRAWGTPETVPDTAERVPDTPETVPDTADVRARHALPLRHRGVDSNADPFTRGLLLFAGKGGVGKTTCAAACALTLAEERPVAIFSTDPAGSLADVLETSVPPDGTEIGPRLSVRQIDAEAEFERFRTRYRDRVERLFESLGLERAAMLDRRVVESLWDLAPPGIDEIIALLRILEFGGGHADVRATREPPVLVIDAAPTGHFLRLLEMPGLALEWTHALMRVFVKYRAALRLDESGENLLNFAKRLKASRSRLMDPDCTAAFLVTLDEAMVRAETERLGAALRRADIPVAAVIDNRSGGARPDGSGAEEPRRIIAPRTEPPPVGTDALRDFFARWRIAS